MNQLYCCDKCCQRAHYRANRDKILKRKADSYAADQKKFARRDKVNYRTNRDKIRKRKADYYVANRAKIAKEHAAYYAANRDKALKGQAASASSSTGI